jgi:hypothetical protein
MTSGPRGSSVVGYNLRTAKSLGIAIPRSLLPQANDLIE